ncbi:hypothetical protein K503DRAFT_165833 [Rhizopogon vinicolor AM-OR11-026]|uniref:Uncharacterized protein n=1 Tax=Rhizopogon vinicolor AM-OR11-026 TaxID=1314800 RepID=A0A1B7MDW2_9AGAM|nr:hypothetical protein K503DRAFT_165833 [Rhizopogon vinicolor AM-OR11-026]
MHAMERHCGPPALQQQTELRRELRVPSTLLSNCLDSQNGTKVKSPVKDSWRLSNIQRQHPCLSFIFSFAGFHLVSFASGLVFVPRLVFGRVGGWKS